MYVLYHSSDYSTEAPSLIESLHILPSKLHILHLIHVSKKFWKHIRDNRNRDIRISRIPVPMGMGYRLWSLVQESSPAALYCAFGATSSLQITVAQLE